MFHREGFKIICISLVIVIITCLVSQFYLETYWLRKAIQLGALLSLIMILQFFRNPTRATLADDNYVISPVDGKVVVIEEVFESEYLKNKCLQISIFMSPFNVHVTRYPISGKVIYSNYHPGKYLVAWHPKASHDNERTTVVVENDFFGKVLHRQIAGAMAKRIVNYAKVGDYAVQGSDSGFIKFGSRVDILLPLDTKIDVKLGQKVKGGIDIIAQKV